MVYVTSDLHFHHAGIIGLANRSFENVNEMNTTLLNNWNSVINSRDEVYIIGDFAFHGTGAQVSETLKRLKGKKYLVLGNHDSSYLKDQDFDTSLYEWIKEYYVLSYEGNRFVMFHYPILEWQFYYKNSVHLFGHIHTREFMHPDKRAFNVGVDVNNYFPINLKTLCVDQ
jgi:calcineurin-like phosphoesterase family protein